MLKIYSKDNCPQCTMAMNMIKAKGLDFTVLKLGTDYTKEQLLALAPNARTVPQVFDGETLIGGLPELQRHLVSR